MKTPKPKPTPPISKREADLLAALKMIAATTKECGEYMRGIALSAIERHEGKDFAR